EQARAVLDRRERAGELVQPAQPPPGGGEQRFELAQLAGVEGREDQVRQAHPAGRRPESPSSRRWLANTRPMPSRARRSIARSSASLNETDSPVPCTSTKRPAPVMTTFMSTWALESSR